MYYYFQIILFILSLFGLDSACNSAMIYFTSIFILVLSFFSLFLICIEVFSASSGECSLDFNALLELNIVQLIVVVGVLTRDILLMKLELGDGGKF